MSAELAAFNAALAELQAELPVIGKDQTANAGQFSYSYADLTTIAAKALPLLSKHGLAFTAFPTMSEHGFVLKFSLRHKDGHSEEGFYPLPDPVKATAQQIGSGITYGRRYCLCAATGIAPGGEDDDGAAAGHAQAAARRPDPLKAAKDRVWVAAQALGWDGESVAVDYMRENNAQIASA